MPSTEAETRRKLIDEQLARAGWNVGNPRQVITELALRYGGPSDRISETDNGYGTEYADYALLDAAGVPLAVVEAKREERDSLAGKRQAEDYAQAILDATKRRPFIFLSNGQQLWFWHWGAAPPRQVAGFFTRYELERLRFLDEYRRPLYGASPNSKIVDRSYQLHAIKAVTEAMERGQRKSLLVMATGTGKTRTAIALVDLLIRQRWVQRVLFLADRRELVKQALGDFKQYLPNETRQRIEGGEIDDSARIHVTTYPSMMQVYTRLTPGYYDLVIADESHRSIYNRYKPILDYFDACQLGLTATPTDFIEHNTFELFECADGLPTYMYSYKEAVDDQHLAQYKVLDAQTNFQIQGIKAGQLPPEMQRQLTEQGIELDEIDFEGSDLERRVTNTGTNDAIAREFMEKSRKDATGTLPAKAIIFAMTHRHAVELWKSFNRLYPDLQRRGLAEVIDSHMERAESTLSDFKNKDMPRVAISVDMLDTGVDVPAVQTLVLAKPVFSYVKFWQMVGRGTRRWTDPQTGKLKKDFLIIDHWSNFAYFNLNPEGETASATEPLPVRLFRARVEKLLLLRGQGEEPAAGQSVNQLQDMLAQIPADNVNVRPHLARLVELAEPGGWDELDEGRVDGINHAIAPLLRFLPDVNFASMSFELRTERLAAAYLAGQGDEQERLRVQVLKDLTLLPEDLPEVAAQAEKLAWARSPGFWDHLDYARIMKLQATFAPLMRWRRTQHREMLTLNLPDQIARRLWIIYGPAGEGAFAEGYRERAEARVRALADELPALAKLTRGESLTDDEIAGLAGALNQADLFITEDVLRQVYERPDAELVDFLRDMLGLSTLPGREQQIRGAFEAYIAAHPRYTAVQIQFLRTIAAAVVSRARLTTADLERPPFSRAGAARRLFTDGELDEIVQLANRLAA